jgi:hypothetical protein
VAKRSSDVLATVAKGVGRTLGRLAKRVDQLKRKKRAKAASGKKKRAKPKKDPVAAARKAKVRETWKAEARRVEGVEHATHLKPVDERAIVRATSGQHWSARKAR